MHVTFEGRKEDLDDIAVDIRRAMSDIKRKKKINIDIKPMRVGNKIIKWRI